MEPCQGEETSPNNALAPTGVWTALGASQEPALGPGRAFSSCIHRLSCAKPEGTATPLAQSPFPRAHKRMLPMPRKACASVSVAGSSIPGIQVLTWAALWFDRSPALRPAHTLTHALMLTFSGKSTPVCPTPATPAHMLGAHTPHLLRHACCGHSMAAGKQLLAPACPGRERASSSPGSAGQHHTCLARGALLWLPCGAQHAGAVANMGASLLVPPRRGLRFMPPMLQLPGRRPRQRSLLCAHSTVPKHLPAHIHVMLMEWSWDRTGRTWGTGRHSPTRMRTQTSSAMRAPGLSVADTT